MSKQYYLYIVASPRNGTLYIGVTSDIIKRITEHKMKAVPGFTSKYNVDKLVYYEIYPDPISAITREKNIKKWNRRWKLRLIEETNPQWCDLYYEIIGSGFPPSRE